MAERTKKSSGCVRRLLVVCLLAGGLIGCAGTSPWRQSFVEVETPNFHVTSSLGDGPTRALVHDLEVFHAGVRSALGLDPDAPARARTRVLAFDGRGVERPFAIRGASSSVVPSIDGATLVIRAPGGFEERVDPEVRHQYAHRVLRDHAGELLPLWYEEGRAQLARTIRVRKGEAEVGRVASEHRARVLDWRRSDLAEIVRLRQVARFSQADRELFEAQSWAIVHTLLFADGSRRGGRSELDRIRDAFGASGDWARVSIFDVLGTDPATLTARVYAHLEGKAFRATRLRVETFEASDLELRPVASHVANRRLAELALELMRWELASDYFERILRERPADPLALAGWALARARKGDFEGLDALAARAREADEAGETHATDATDATDATGATDTLSAAAQRDSAKRELWLGWAYLARAEQPVSPASAAADRRAAEQAFRASVERATGPGEGATAWLGLSQVLVGVTDQAEEAYRRLEQARSLQPGSLWIRLASARIASGLGRDAAAASEAAQVVSRSHWGDLIRAALPFISDR